MAEQLIDNVRKEQVELVAKSHSTISIQSCSQLLGLTLEDAVARCQSMGWAVQGEFIRPIKSSAPVTQTLSADQLQALTDYVCSLDTK